MVRIFSTDFSHTFADWKIQIWRAKGEGRKKKVAVQSNHDKALPIALGVQHLWRTKIAPTAEFDEKMKKGRQEGTNCGRSVVAVGGQG